MAADDRAGPGAGPGHHQIGRARVSAGQEELPGLQPEREERAEAAGNDVTLEVWPNMIHVWHFFAAMLPEAQQAIDRIGEWVRATTGARTGAEVAAG